MPTPGGGSGAPGAGGETPPANQGSAPQTFEAWLGSQDAAIKGLIDNHVNGLRGALETERTQRKDFERQVKDLAGKLEKGSEGRQQAEALAGQIATLERQAAFYDAAHAAGVANLRLAWLAAQEAKLIDDKGHIDMLRLKEQFPELFRATGAGPQAPPSNPANPANPGRSGGTLTREAIQRMTPAEINARWDEIQKYMMGG